MKTKFATATIHIAKSIEVHLTGAVATISQKNQAIVGAVGQAVIQVIDQHFHPVVSVFSFSVFKAKAFRFCLCFFMQFFSFVKEGLDCGNVFVQLARRPRWRRGAGERGPAAFATPSRASSPHDETFRVFN